MIFTDHFLFKVNNANRQLPENTFNIEKLSDWLNHYKKIHIRSIMYNNLVRVTFLLLNIFIL